MSTIINGTSNAITFPDSSVQNTSAIVSGYVPYANLPAGSVLQVVQGSTSTGVSSASSTFADTGLTATITPKSATSKILVLISHPENYKNSGSSTTALGLRLLRNGTEVILFNSDVAYTGTTILYYFSASYNYLDSPASSSALTYKTQFRSTYSTASVNVQSNSVPSTITLMEIAG
jgi:hypothetical protein